MSGLESTGERIGRELGGKIGRALGEWVGKKLDLDTTANEGGAEQDTDTEAPVERDNGAVSETPTSRAELEEMSYRRLQLLAKDVGVKANTKKEEMVENVAAELGIDSET